MSQPAPTSPPTQQPAGRRKAPPLPPLGFSPAFLIVAYVLVGSLPLLLIGEEQAGGFWRKFSGGLAMVAFALLTVQCLISGRLQRIAGRAGIDRVMHFHQLAAKAITVALVLHPFLYVVPIMLSNPLAAFRELIVMFSNGAYASGVLAWVMLLALTVSAMLRNWLPVPYEAWRLSHGLGAAALAIAGLHHAVNVGSYSAEITMAQLWIVLVALTFLVIGYLYFVKPWQLSQRPYYVSHVFRVGEGLWGVTLWPAKLQPVGVFSRGLKPKVTKAISFEAGQYAWVTIGASPFVLSDHPLSISSAPSDSPRFRFIVKETGDFSKTLGKFPIGTRAYMDGPYGHFTLSTAEATFAKDQKAAGIAFIAGGVGIAPILSLLRDRQAAGEIRPMRLLYGNRSVSQIVFRDELEKMEAAMDLRIRHVLSEPPYEWSGSVGILDAAAIGDWLDWPEPESWVYFVCGPAAMMDEVERTLLARGVPPARILTERFQYD